MGAHASSVDLTHNAENILDGDNSTLAITEEEVAPWLAIEYPEPTEIGKVELVADNQDAAELKNCEVRLVDNVDDVLGNAMYTEGNLLGSWAGPALNGETVTINPPGRNHFAAGRFVLVQCRTDGAKLRLAEVRVFGGGTSKFYLLF